MYKSLLQSNYIIRIMDYFTQITPILKIFQHFKHYPSGMLYSRPAKFRE